MLEQKVDTTIQQKWISKLLGYEFSIEFKNYQTNKMVDALSICGTENEPIALLVISFPTPVWLQELKQAYLEDLVVQDLFVKLQQNSSSIPLFSVKYGVFL